MAETFHRLKHQIGAVQSGLSWPPKPVAHLSLAPLPVRLAATRYFATGSRRVYVCLINCGSHAVNVLERLWWWHSTPPTKLSLSLLLLLQRSVRSSVVIEALQVDNRLCTLQKTFSSVLPLFSFESFRDFVQQELFVAMIIIFIPITLLPHAVASQNTGYRPDGRCGSDFSNAPCDPLLSGACCSISG